MKEQSIFEQDLKKTFFKLAIPSIIGMLIISSQIMVDGLYVSNFVGSNGLAAVNLALPFFNFLFGVVVMISVGGAVLTSIFKGKKNFKKSNEMFCLTFYTYIIISIIISIFSYVFREQIIHLLGANENIYKLVNDYFQLMAIYFFFLNLPVILQPFMRISEKVNLIVLSSLLALILNIVMDYLFVVKLKKGLRGAAYGSIIADGISGMLLIILLIIKEKKFSFVKIKIDWKLLKNIFYNGSSEMFTVIATSITGYVFNILLMRRLGEIGVAAMSIVLYTSVYVNIVLVGLSQALQPIVSYNIGAERMDRISKVLKISLISGAIIGIMVFLLIERFGINIIQLFSKENMELKKLSLEIITVFAFAYLFSFINIIISTFHTAIEKPIESVIIAVSRSMIFVIFFLLMLPKFMGIKGLWVATPLAEVCCVMLSLILLKKSIKELKNRFNVKRGAC